MKQSPQVEEKLAKMQREAEERDAQRQADKSGFKYLNLSTTPISTEALALIQEETAREIKAAVIEIKENKLALIAHNPTSNKVQELVKQFNNQNYKVSLFTVSLASLNYVFGFYKFVSKEAKKITGGIEVEKGVLGLKLSTLSDFSETLKNIPLTVADIAKIFEIVLNGALLNRASDIHFEPAEKKVKLRVRIDGILHDVFEEIDLKFYQFLLSRIKLLSNLKINVRDEPQDGRFTIELPGKKVEVRVAIAPSEFGEVVVMRLLDPAAINLSLADLGLREDDLKIIEVELNRPNGMILNTGPTGSGKTTTLYAFLRHKKNSEIKIITVEDPIEYHLDGIEQTQVDEEAGYTFADGLRSLMRQDPDVILVGEMRDKETSEIGIQAALTGHLVLSTIHANSAAGAIPRLLDIGVKPTSIGPALNLAIAQRLIRRFCANCKTPMEINEELKNKIDNFLKNLPNRVNKENYKEIKLFQAKGCEKCNNSGYKGRVAIYELLLNDPDYERLLKGETSADEAKLATHKDLEELIIAQTGESAIKKWAIENQEMVTMQQDGILKVISGLTTLEEVEGAIGIIVW